MTVGTRRESIHALTGLRAIAALLVYVRHYPVPNISFGGTFMSSGYAGVTFFFVLSGFIISYNYSDRFSSTLNSMEVYRFWVARCARVYPLYAATMLYAWWAGDFKTNPTLFLLGIQAWVGDVGVVYGLNGVGWSISVELFLYLCAPFLICALGRVGVLCYPRRLAAAASLVIALLVAGGAYFYIFSTPNQPIEWPTSAHRWLYHNPLTRLGDFALGILCAILYLRMDGTLTQRGKKRWKGLGYISLIAIVVLMDSKSFYSTPYSWDAAYALLFAILILSVSVTRGSIIERFLSSRVMVLAGEASYAFYLVHILVIQAVAPLMKAVPPSVGYTLTMCTVWCVAALLHFFFEGPTRRAIRALVDVRLGRGATRSDKILS
ncbi:acyltransferase [Bordetella sp. LUAb4]|uniref:acyltransferase family protein n=1 Tax=Bordetella sp. LUAb4 TaxID=2843195 RepID=UPI001E4AF2B1|nr:acyltransferase [Bordetella sp. LUAb4]